MTQNLTEYFAGEMTQNLTSPFGILRVENEILLA